MKLQRKVVERTGFKGQHYPTECSSEIYAHTRPFKNILLASEKGSMLGSVSASILLLTLLLKDLTASLQTILMWFSMSMLIENKNVFGFLHAIF